MTRTTPKATKAAARNRQRALADVRHTEYFAQRARELQAKLDAIVKKGQAQ